MASQRNPGAGGTARGASDVDQVARLNDPEDKPIPGIFQCLGYVTARIVKRLEDERLEPVE